MVRQQVPHDADVVARTRSCVPRPLECREELVTERYHGEGDVLDVVEAGEDEGNECVWDWGDEGWRVEDCAIGYAGLWEGE